MDFDKILYNAQFESPFAYEKYMGRIKVKEVAGEIVIKKLNSQDKFGESVFSKNTVKRNLDVAYISE